MGERINADILEARPLLILGDYVTTDHISPAGAISPKSAAGKFLLSKGVSEDDFNTYGSRRGNHEVMIRGTFANPRIKNLMVGGVEGSITKHYPDGETMSVYDAAMRYQEGKYTTPSNCRQRIRNGKFQRLGCQRTKTSGGKGSRRREFREDTQEQLDRHGSLTAAI